MVRIINNRGNTARHGSIYRLVIAAIVLFACGTPASAKAKYIILMIADGTGYNCFEAASYYEYGRLGRQPYEQEGWNRYFCRTSPLSVSDWASGDKQDKSLLYDPGKAWSKKPDAIIRDKWGKAMGTGAFAGYNYVKTNPTDSAAAATALACGIKTYNAAIDFSNADDGTPLYRQTIAELAKARGMATGVITTVPWCDATPAALGGAHSAHRGSLLAIANEMLAAKHLDVIMGAGNPEYDANGAPREPNRESDYDAVGGPETWAQLVEGTHLGGWKLVQSKEEFASLMAGRTPLRVLGTAKVARTLQQGRNTRDWNNDGLVDAKDRQAALPFADPTIPTVPTLEAMARGAMNVLDYKSAGKGFYLMIEGGAIDWANHARQPGRMIEEMVDFNKAVAAVVKWIETNSSWDESLLIITADHETGMVWGPDSDIVPFDPIVNNGKGNMPGVRHNHYSHTNSLVALWARGPGATSFDDRVVGFDPRRGAFVENTDVFAVMKEQLPGTAAPKAKAAKQAEAKNEAEE